MTRINVVKPETLFSLHLLAEYRELPRVFALVAQSHKKSSNWKRRQPQNYVLGPGHVLFFYDRLKWLAKRHRQLVKELQRRGYEPKFTGCLIKKWRDEIPEAYWRDWSPSEEDVTLNKARIALRLKDTTWWKAELPFFI